MQFISQDESVTSAASSFCPFSGMSSPVELVSRIGEDSHDCPPNPCFQKSRLKAWGVNVYPHWASLLEGACGDKQDNRQRGHGVEHRYHDGESAHESDQAAKVFHSSPAREGMTMTVESGPCSYSDSMVSPLKIDLKLVVVGRAWCPRHRFWNRPEPMGSPLR